MMCTCSRGVFNYVCGSRPAKPKKTLYEMEEDNEYKALVGKRRDALRLRSLRDPDCIAHVFRGVLVSIAPADGLIHY